MRFVFIMFLLNSFSLSANNALIPFVSDGCSGFPDGNFSQPQRWLLCCEAHDFDYWKGGSSAERLSSDHNLQKCVANLGHPTIAVLMFAGVRVGGSPYLPTPFRWGYGWPFPKGYAPLTPNELQQVKAMSL